MADRPPFDLLRAAFVLVAIVVLAELAFTMAGAISCIWLIWQDRYRVGACETVATQARDIFGELLTAILALLLAGRKPPE